jgi:hypothetical protein
VRGWLSRPCKRIRSAPAAALSASVPAGIVRVRWGWRWQPIRPELPGHPETTLPGWAQALGHRPTLYVSLGTVPLFNQLSRFRELLAELVDEEIELVVTVSPAP